jgi:predicted nucleic acid-binding protein
VKPEDVPAGVLLLDTNAFSYLLRGGPRAAAYSLLVADHDLTISFITVGEVLAGAIKAEWPDERRAQLEVRIAAVGKLSGTDKVARSYAELKARFRGSKEDNDLWIAACALAASDPLPLVTGDHDFDEIAEAFGLTIIRPD